MLHVVGTYADVVAFVASDFPKGFSVVVLPGDIVMILNESWEDRQTQYTSVSAQTWHGYRKCWRSSTASSVQLLLPILVCLEICLRLLYYCVPSLWAMASLSYAFWNVDVFSMPWILLLSPLPLLLLLLIWMTLFLTQPTECCGHLCLCLWTRFIVSVVICPIINLNGREVDDDYPNEVERGFNNRIWLQHRFQIWA